MRHGGGILWLLLTILISSPVHPVELSDVVIPSDDELDLALELGDITYDQYLLLVDLARIGLDSSTLYLLDAIPNLAYFAGDSLGSINSLEVEQQRGMAMATGLGRKPSGRDITTIRYQYNQETIGRQRGWYRTQVRGAIGENLLYRFSFDRTRSGTERITDRLFQVRPSRDNRIRLDVGSICTQFGLGTVIGYRGKLFRCGEGFGAESLRYPDNGGFNGALGEMNSGPYSARILFSNNRDTCASLTTTAVELALEHRSIRSSIIGSYSSLKNREHDYPSVTDLDLNAAGVSIETGTGRQRIAGEISIQSAAGRHALSGVIEGSHVVDGTSIRYAMWGYGDDMVDLTSGSKAGSLSRSFRTPEAGFEYRARRPGQEGMVMKTRVPVSPGRFLSLSALYAGFSGTHWNSDLALSLEEPLTKKMTLELAYLGKLKRRPESGSEIVQNHRFRFDARFMSDKLTARAYIAANSDGTRVTDWSCFMSGKYRLPCGSEIDMWGRVVVSSNGDASHWYMYIRGQQHLTAFLSGAAKLSHAFVRSSSTPHQTTIFLEATVLL